MEPPEPSDPRCGALMGALGMADECCGWVIPIDRIMELWELPYEDLKNEVLAYLRKNLPKDPRAQQYWMEIWNFGRAPLPGSILGGCERDTKNLADNENEIQIRWMESVIKEEFEKSKEEFEKSKEEFEKSTQDQE